MLMHKILQNHLLCAFVANLKIGAIYALYPESFCNKNLANRKVFASSDSVSVQVCWSTGPWPCPPWSCSSQDERQRARLPQVLPGDESGRIFLYNIDVLVFSGCTIKLITFWFSVGVLCALLPSWPLLCAKIHLEGCRGGQGQHACCGKIDELSEININNSWLWFFKSEMSFSFFNCNIRIFAQDMYGPSMVINSSDRSDRIKTIVKYFKEMRGGWEILAIWLIKKCRY